MKGPFVRKVRTKGPFIPIAGVDRSWLRDARDAAGQEAMSGDPFGDPCPVEVGRDATEVEGPPRSQQETRIHVRNLGDNPFVQHQPDLLRNRGERAISYLLLSLR
jgi:hypothetical protein